MSASGLRRTWRRVSSGPQAQPQIHLALVDDWELRGDGSGNMRAIQFETMRRLRTVYEENGLRGSFNAEVMQQLTHLRLGREHDELRALAHEWEEVVRETFSRGHDVQLHVHPQWSDAVYEEGRWRLRASWSILEYSEHEVRQMLQRAKRYLEELLQPIDPTYRCVSFRSGAWCIAPSPSLLPTLAELGIVFDMSIVEGLFSDTQHVKLDYRRIEEPFLPYYPRMDDARRLSERPQPIVCIPTHSFDPGRVGIALRHAARAVRRRAPRARTLTRRFVAPSETPIRHAGYDAAAYSRSEWTPRQGERQRVTKVPSDIAALSAFQMSEMLRDIRRRARGSGLSVVPIVLENHSKDLGDIEPIALFARAVARADDLDVITLTELARNIENGTYHVRTR
jgi:hypothetical protein